MRFWKNQGLFDINKYKDALNASMRKGKIARSSAEQYIGCLESLNTYFNESGEKPTSSAIKKAIVEIVPISGWQHLGAIRTYEDQVLKVRNSVLSYKDYNELNQYYHQKDNEKDREPAKTLYTYVKFMNGMKEPYRLLFWFQLQTGLRASEVSDLEPRDIKFEKRHIYVHVRNGKGGKERFVRARHDMALYNALKSHIEEKKYLSPKGKIFPSPETVRDYQKKNLDEEKSILRTHDMRRYNARMRFVDALKSGFSKYEALYKVAEQLGHANIADTKKYVGKVFSDPYMTTKGGVCWYNDRIYNIEVTEGRYHSIRNGKKKHDNI